MFEAEPGVEREVWIWKPKAMSDSNNACLFWAHGGGCVMFHPKDFRESMIYMAIHMNVVVVSPDYRLAPEHKMPAGICDAEACFHFMYDNADKFGFNANRMCMSGESGGALVALGATIRLTQAGHGQKVRALFLYDPMTSNPFEGLDPSLLTAVELEGDVQKEDRDTYGLLATDYEK